VSRAAAPLLAILGIAILAAISLTAPKLVGDYYVRVLIVICINAILVVSLGIGNGFTGVFSLGHVGFVAVGAYVSASSRSRPRRNPPICRISPPCFRAGTSPSCRRPSWRASSA